MSAAVLRAVNIKILHNVSTRGDFPHKLKRKNMPFNKMRIFQIKSANMISLPIFFLRTCFTLAI